MSRRSRFGLMSAVAILGLFGSNAVRAEVLRFDCTHLGMSDEKRVGDLTAVVSLDDSGTDTPVAVDASIETVSLYKRGFLGGYTTLLNEQNLSLSGDYCLSPRELPRADRKARDMNLGPASNPSTQIRQIYLSTLPKASYVVLKNGDTFVLDCALDPM